MAEKPLLRAPIHAHRAGYRTTLSVLGEQVWWTKCFLGLRCELRNLPDIRPAKIALTMEPRAAKEFRGFADELPRSHGNDYVELLLRVGLSDAGVRTLYVAESDGRPAYAQWLIRQADQDVIHEHSPGRYERLHEDEVLLEGAYTFIDFRRLGAMGDGMGQLLYLARAEGARSAITYVAADNVPSLRGCANVGFELDHARWSVRRLGRRRSLMRDVDPRAREAWARATA
jgi:hypothetical protein